MKSLPVFAIGLLLMVSGHLAAQAPDRSTRADDPFGGVDPFGRDVNAPNSAAPTRLESDSIPTKEPADQSQNREPSEHEDLFPPVVVLSRASAAHQRIEQALNRETAFDYLDQPLRDVVDDISYNHDIPIIIDNRALEDYGIDTGTPITRSLKGVRLRSALRLMLRNLELTYVVRDEVLQITTPEVAASEPSTRFYHVAQLLPSNRDGKVLVELIKTLVAPKTWCGSDSVGSIIYVEHLESLAIRQTDEVFHEIEELLAATKKLAGMQPVRDAKSYGMPGGAIPEETPTSPE